MSKEYSDDELRDARDLTEKQTGHRVSDQEMIQRFGRTVPRTGDSGPTGTSSRTIHVDELPPADTSQSGRHKGPGIIRRMLGGKKD